MDRKVKLGDKLVVTKKQSKFMDVGVVLKVIKINTYGFWVDIQFGSRIYFEHTRIGEFLAFVDEVEETEAQPLTYREKLAEKIFIAWHARGEVFHANYAFVAADKFIGELENQRKGDTQEKEDA